ncbi:MAG TPA: DUF6175 family protein [Spirochaetota bacterium]|nr:hypothetical protein [Spirochaetota bacterium]HOM88911.1 DUF6175 family protein [Spirochaetota bacterium]HPD04927.1 DUF6175 family protein [Spirochaetota bacterium]HQG42200.1 DUF6175 family protein [Spirochaetota bacterium]HRR60747.1 DUF6175 family protein [Spirochaetota bacterium]
MKRYFFWTSLCIIVALVACGGAQKQQKPSKTACEMCGEADGFAAIFDNDTALARDRAIDDAMNKLVKMKLGTSIEGRTVVEDYALVESIVEAKSTGMVRNWKVIKEGAQEGAYTVRIYGEVYPQAVNDTIEATLKNYGRPKFMILINETFEGQKHEPGFTVTELTMMEIMQNAGFEFVDAATVQQLIKKDKAKMMQAMIGRVGGAVQELLLDDVGAECIIVGDVTTTDQSNVLQQYSANMKSKQAILNLKAIDVYTGSILASTSTNMPGAHINAEAASKKAIQSALVKILGSTDEETGKFKSGPFMNQITKKFLLAATHRMITLNIVGLDYNDLTKFRDILQNRIRGIQKVYVRGQAGKQSKIDVEFAGKTTDLADELVGKASSIGFKIEVKETYPNKIMLIAQKL